MRSLILISCLGLAPLALAAQQPLPASQQIQLSVLPLPKAFRDGATVLGYDAAGTLVTLRAGKGFMTCLASNPKDADFHAACYANALSAFMARGRYLRAHGTPETRVDTVRFAEIRSGKLAMPKQGAALWKLDGPMSGVNAGAGTVTSAIKASYVVYMPFATVASTGLPDEPTGTGPWLMLPGTPKAHIMFSMTM